MRKAAGLFIALIGLGASVVGLIQAFSFEQLPVVACRYHEYGQQRGANILDCVYRLYKLSGKTVVLDWATGGDMNGKPFLRRASNDSIYWFFDSCDMHEAIGRNCGSASEREQVESDQLMYQTYNSSNVLNVSGLPWNGNGMWVEITGLHQTTNPFSAFYTSEGTDIAEGPYQITQSFPGEQVTLRLSPAPMTNSLAAQVRCSARDWPPLVKFLVCPFA